MKKAIAAISWISVIIIFLPGALSCKLGRFVVYNFADIKDYKKFPHRDLQADTAKFLFYTAANSAFPEKIKNKYPQQKSFDEYLEVNKTVAFLVIRNDSIEYERYFKGYDEASIVPSFSMAKSITSILIGCAIDDGFIRSVKEPVIQYIPELTKNGFDKVTIEHLLQMTSGLAFNESYYNPFGDAASFYYGRRLRKAIARMKLKREPGTKFEYSSGSTQLLGLVLERALKNKTITQYFQEKLWHPLGMEYDASWSLDKKKNGLEKTFCCINARARDFAKIGRLYLEHGNWNGRQVVSEHWVRESTKAARTNGSVSYYQYQWWLPSQMGDFMANGFLGQFIYVNPAKNLVIVRLGKSTGGISWQNLFTGIASMYPSN